MKHLCLYSLCLTLFLGSCNRNNETSKETKLHFQPKEGLKKDLVYEFTIESPSQKAELNYVIEAKFEVVRLKDSTAEVKLTYNDISLTGHVDTLKIDVSARIPDSTQIEGALYGQPYFICLGHEFLVIFDQSMKKLSEELLTPKSPGSLTEPVNKIQFFTTLPVKPIEVGTKWNDVIELKSGKNHLVDAEFIIKKIEKDVASGEFSGDLDGSGSKFEYDYSMKGKVYGTFELDIPTGLPLKSEMTQDLILTMSEKETPMKFIIKQYFK